MPAAPAPAAAALIAVAIVHRLDGPGSLRDRFYAGTLELALAACCLPLAIVLILRPVRALSANALAPTVVARPAPAPAAAL